MIISLHNLISLQDGHSFPKPNPYQILWTALPFLKPISANRLWKSLFWQRTMEAEIYFCATKKLTHSCLFFLILIFLPAHKSNLQGHPGLNWICIFHYIYKSTSNTNHKNLDVHLLYSKQKDKERHGVQCVIDVVDNASEETLPSPVINTVSSIWRIILKTASAKFPRSFPKNCLVSVCGFCPENLRTPLA